MGGVADGAYSTGSAAVRVTGPFSEMKRFTASGRPACRREWGSTGPQAGVSCEADANFRIAENMSRKKGYCTQNDKFVSRTAVEPADSENMARNANPGRGLAGACN